MTKMTESPAVLTMADAHSRRRVLEFASALTSDKGSAAAVTVNAGPLLAWLEAASGEHDMYVRLGALARQYRNTLEDPPDDNPERFLAEARTLYAFMAAGAEG
jgi:hypothetical protein